jgi:VWFA-related protein
MKVMIRDIARRTLRRGLVLLSGAAVLAAAVAQSAPGAAEGSTPAAQAAQTPSKGGPRSGGSAATTGQQPLRGGVTNVDIPVLVLGQNGVPIAGLTRDNFYLSDDGKPQRIVGFESEPQPLALAIVVDTTERDAVEQARRSAATVASQLIGANGEGSVFIAGAEGRQLMPFTTDRDRLIETLRHIQLGPEGPDITEAVELAILRLRHEPRDHTRAVLVISQTKPRGGLYSRAIVETSMADAIPVFYLSPNTPKTKTIGPNPVSTAENGTGVGSQRTPHPASPVDEHGNPAPPPGSTANIDLGPLGSIISRPFSLRKADYVSETGGLELVAHNDGDFDRKLSSIGDALRGYYHIYFNPDDLDPTPEIHGVEVTLEGKPRHSKVIYRHSYVGYLVR